MWGQEGGESDNGKGDGRIDEEAGAGIGRCRKRGKMGRRETEGKGWRVRGQDQGKMGKRTEGKIDEVGEA